MDTVFVLAQYNCNCSSLCNSVLCVQDPDRLKSIYFHLVGLFIHPLEHHGTVKDRQVDVWKKNEEYYSFSTMCSINCDKV